MDTRQEIRNAPKALKETLEKGRPEFEALVRRTRWGEGPVYLIGSGSSYYTALAGRYAFEELLGWLVVTRRAADFAAYSSSLIRPGSVLVAISPSGECEETIEAARLARSRGAVLLALTGNAISRLAETADGVFLLRPGESGNDGILARLCLHAGIGYLSLVAAQVLKRHHQKLDALGKEFEDLPGHAEWILTRLADAVRSLAGEIRGLDGLALVGAGFYYPAALQAAVEFNRRTQLRTFACEASDCKEDSGFGKGPGTGALFLSGSRCRLKKKLYAAVQKAGRGGARVFAVTDGNDRVLTDLSAVAVLLPSLSEMTGSTLSLLFIQWLATYLAEGDRAADRRPPRTPPA
jgi:glucosamine--fructose-6-phosphate aminotransferase (isomerizing)